MVELLRVRIAWKRIERIVDSTGSGWVNVCNLARMLKKFEN